MDFVESGMGDVDLPTAWGALIDLWIGFLRSASKPETTIYLRSYQVRRFAIDHALVDPLGLTLDDLATWLGSFNWKVETRRSYRAALRSFYHWAHVTGRIPADPAALLPAITPPITQPRPLPEDYFRRALSTSPERVVLMVELGAFVGMRRAEISVGHSDDLSEDLEGWSILIHGKGRRERTVPLLPALAVRLRKLPAGYFFPGQIDGHLSPHYVGKLISDALPAGWAAHNLRHRFASKFFEAERDIRAVQEALGHASVVTTQRYTKVPQSAMRRGITSVA